MAEKLVFPINFRYQCNAKKVLHKEGVFRAAEQGFGHPRFLLIPNCRLYNIQTVGRGSFGVVYKAQMKYYPYSVRAIKRIKTKYIKNPEATIREYSVLSSLDHPNIVKIYETYEDEENLFLVTEYTYRELVTAKAESCSHTCRRRAA